MSVCEFVVYVKPFDDNAKSFHSIRDKNPFNRENTTFLTKSAKVSSAKSP